MVHVCCQAQVLFCIQLDVRQKGILGTLEDPYKYSKKGKVLGTLTMWNGQALGVPMEPQQGKSLIMHVRCQARVH